MVWIIWGKFQLIFNLRSHMWDRSELKIATYNFPSLRTWQLGMTHCVYHHVKCGVDMMGDNLGYKQENYFNFTFSTLSSLVSHHIKTNVWRIILRLNGNEIEFAQPFSMFFFFIQLSNFSNQSSQSWWDSCFFLLWNSRVPTFFSGSCECWAEELE